MRNQRLKSWRSAEQSLLGGMALASLTAACIWLVLGPAPEVADYLIAVALLFALFLASLIVMHLVGSTRRQMEAALESRASAERRAIEALRESEAQWKEVFEHNPVMYFMVDADGTVLSVNTFGAAQLGYQVRELRGQSVLTVFFEEDRDVVRKSVEVCLAHIGQTHSWEIRKVRKDGSALWVRENAKAVQRQDNRLIVLIACEDITERKEAENALRQSENYLAEAQRLSHTGSFGWCVATGEIIWSDETFRIFGFDKAPSVALDTVIQRIHPDDQARAQQTIDRASGDGKDFYHEYRLLMPDGSIKHVHATAHAVTDASGGIEFVGAVTDVTARKQAEEKLQEAQAGLAHVTRVTALGELAASIAHEVNQPLAAVVANAAAAQRWLDRDTPDLQEARSALGSIVDDGNRAGEVIQRVRALVSKTTDQMVPLDINEVVNEVIALLHRELFGHRILLRTELAAVLGQVLGDRIQLQQVILNLVVNGIEAMQPVTDRPRKMTIRTHQEQVGQILVAVTDSGVGLACQNADRVFDPFFTTKSEGMGIGLSICRSIVESHGGRLSAFGNEGPGATFQFSLPVHREDDTP
ncbi:PAS domain S-box protein [Afipia sp. GAS231]|uniref:PAS domain-containing sensor histidine kinase n=1 Tax=Afipia sp. GAS231 TaxID=1882747 RepID=UPI00087A1237|nr:PAS domain S-box protein [Afipia sp. GAS231]SDN16311.1 PAS domain S-box-containing protein [Afipia sp. GAS231]